MYIFITILLFLIFMLRIMIQKDLSENQETMIYLEKLLIEMSKEDDGIILELNKKEIEENFTNEEYTPFDLASDYLESKVYHSDYLEILNVIDINTHNWNKIIEIIYEELGEFIEEEDLLDEEGE